MFITGTQDIILTILVGGWDLMDLDNTKAFKSVCPSSFLLFASWKSSVSRRILFFNELCIFYAFSKSFSSGVLLNQPGYMSQDMWVLGVLNLSDGYLETYPFMAPIATVTNKGTSFSSSNFIKKDSKTGVFLWILPNFKEHHFL